MTAAAVREGRWIDRQWLPDLDFLIVYVIAERHDANHFRGGAIDQDRLADDGRVAAVAALKQIPGQDRDRRSLRYRISRGEHAAVHRLHAKCRHQFRRHETAYWPARWIRSQIRRAHAVSANRCERLVVVAI